MTQGDVVAEIYKEIVDKLKKLKKCKEISLVLVYHLDPKKLTIKPGEKQTYLDNRGAARDLLDSLASWPTPPPIDEIVLNSCHSSMNSKDIREAAFKNPNVKRVVTQTNACAAACSEYMTGLSWDAVNDQPTFKPAQNDIDIWISSKEKTTVKLKAKEKYNIKTGKVRPWSTNASP